MRDEPKAQLKCRTVR